MSHANTTNEQAGGRSEALARAAVMGDARLVGELLATGARADARLEGGATPLMHAAAGGFADVARALLDAGADVHAHRDDGFTPLILAVFFGHEEVVRLLLERGADPAAETVLGVSARGWADARGFKVIGELLRQPHGTVARTAPAPRATENGNARPVGAAAAVERVLGKPGTGESVTAARRAPAAAPESVGRVRPRHPATPYEPRFEAVDRGFVWPWQALVGVVLLSVAGGVGGVAYWRQAGGTANAVTAPQPAAGAPQTAWPLPSPAAAEAQPAPTPSTDPQGGAVPPGQLIIIQSDPSAQPVLIAPAESGAAATPAPSPVTQRSPEPTPTEPPRREPRDPRREAATPDAPAGRREDVGRENPETQPSPRLSNPRATPSPTPRRVIQWPP